MPPDGGWMDAGAGIRDPNPPLFPPMPPEQAVGLLDEPDFKALSFEKRREAVSAVIDSAFTWAQSQPGFADEHGKDMKEFADKMYEKVDDTHRLTEKAGSALGWARDVAKGFFYDVATLASGEPHVVEGLQKSFVHKGAELIDSAQQMADEWFSPANNELETGLRKVRDEINEGKVPLTSPENFVEWLGKKSAETLPSLTEWTETRLSNIDPDYKKTAASLAPANSLSAPQNAAMLAAYIRTRDPKIWSQLEKQMLTTPLAGGFGKQRDEILHSEGARILDETWGKGTGEHLLTAGNPLTIAGFLMPMARGAILGKALTGETMAGATLREAAVAGARSFATTIPEQAALGAAMTKQEDPTAGFGEMAKGSAEMVAAGGLMHAAGTVGGAVVNKFRRPQIDPMAPPETPPPAPEGTPPPEPNPTAGATYNAPETGPIVPTPAPEPPKPADNPAAAATAAAAGTDPATKAAVAEIVDASGKIKEGATPAEILNPKPEPPKAPEPAAPAAETPQGTTFEQFRDAYHAAFADATSEDPKVSKAGIDRMRDLADEFPEWAQRVEDESPSQEPNTPQPNEEEQGQRGEGRPQAVLTPETDSPPPEGSATAEGVDQPASGTGEATGSTAPPVSEIKNPPEPEQVNPPKTAPRLVAEESLPPSQRESRPADPATLKAQKAFLIDEIDKAYEAAPDVEPLPDEVERIRANATEGMEFGYSDTEVASKKAIEGDAVQRFLRKVHGEVVIHVPGDGTFRIINSKEAIGNFRKRAEKFPTAIKKPIEPKSGPSTKATELRGTGKPKTLEDRVKIVAGAVSTDKTREIINHVWDTGKEVIATDGRRMAVLKDSTQRSEGYRDAKTGKRKTLKPEIDEKTKKERPPKFPDWKQVYPKDVEKLFDKLDAARMVQALRQAIQVKGDRKNSSRPMVTLYQNADGSLGMWASSGEAEMAYEHNVQPGGKGLMSLDAEWFLEGVEMAMRLGEDKVSIFTSGKGNDVFTHPILLRAGKLDYIQMPMRMAGEESGKVERTGPKSPISELGRAIPRSMDGVWERARHGDESAFDEMAQAVRDRYVDAEGQGELYRPGQEFTPTSFAILFEAAFAAKDFDSILEAVKVSDKSVWVPLLKKFFAEQAKDPVAAAKAEWMRHIFAGTRPPDAKPAAPDAPPQPSHVPPSGRTPGYAQPPPPKGATPPPPKTPPKPGKPPPGPPLPRIPVAPLRDGGEAKSPYQILTDFAKDIGSYIKNWRTPPNVLGFYRWNSATSVIRFAADLDTAAHEVAGHWTDDRYGVGRPWIRSRRPSPYDDELRHFAAHGSRSNRRWVQRAEGIAEYFRAYVMNPDATVRQAPKFTAYARATLPREAWAAIDRFSTDVRRYAGASDMRKAMLNIRMEPPGLVERIRANIMGDPRDFGKSVIDRAAEWFSDQYHYAVKGWETALRMQGRNPDTARGWDNFELLLRFLTGHDARLEDQMRHGLVPLRPTYSEVDGKPVVNRTIDPVTKRVMNLTWLNDQFDNRSPTTQRVDQHATATLMVAQRVVEKAGLIDARANAQIRQIHPLDPTRPQRVRRILHEAEMDKRRLWGTHAGLEGYNGVQIAQNAIRELQQNPERFARLEEAARRYRLWADHNLQYLVDAGRMSREQADRIRSENEMYVDMHRLSEEFDLENLAQKAWGGSGKQAIANVSNVIHRFVGSNLEIDNPYDGLLRQTDLIQREALRNRTMQAFTRSLTSARQMYEGTPVDLDKIGAKARSDDRNTIKVFEDGKATYWKFDKDIHSALKGLGDLGVHAAIELLAAPSSIARYMITHGIGFALRNPIRDAPHRAVISETGSKPWDSLRRFTPEQKGTFMAVGGGNFGHYPRDRFMWNREMKKNMAELRNDPRNIIFLPGRIWKGWERFVEGTELRGRMAEFHSAYKHGRQKLGMSQEDAAMYAAGKARDLMDFAKVGTVMKIINKLVPFSNAHLRGLAASLRAGIKDPGRFAFLWTLYVAAPTLTIRALIHANPETEKEYLQFPGWRRDFFWNIKVGPYWFTIPKPHELGVMAGALERALDTGREFLAQPSGQKELGKAAGHGFEQYGGSLANALLPVGSLGEAAGPLKVPLELYFNRDTFRRRDIIPSWERDLDIDLRKGTEHGSKVGKILGKAINADPRYVDHFLQSYGGIGNMVVDFGKPGIPFSFGAMKASGLSSPPPSTQSVDYQWVMEWAKRRGKTGSKPIRALRALSEEVFQAKDAHEVDRAAKAVREAASAIRSVIEASDEK